MRLNIFSQNQSMDWEAEARQVDRGVVAGLAGSFLLVALGILFTGRAQNFIDPASIMIVFGGTFGATLVHFPVHDIKLAWQGFKSIIFMRKYHATERILYLVELAVKVRKEGLLVLENEASNVEDPFLRRAFELTVDGQSEQDVKRVLENEMRTQSDHASHAIQVFQTMGNYAPAMGLIGTLIGLIQMLGALDDPSKVGPAMSVALITTLYGAVAANLIFLPTAGKLKNISDEESLVKSITLEGMLAIGKQENPMVVEQRLQSFITVKAN